MKIRFVKTKDEFNNDCYCLQYRFLFIWFNFKRFICRTYLQKWGIYLEYDKSKLYETFLNFNISFYTRTYYNSLNNMVREFLLKNKSKIIIENEKIN